MLRRVVVLVVALSMAVAACATTAAVVTSRVGPADDAARVARAIESPLFEAPSTTSTTARRATPATSAAPLPLPEAPPADPYADVPIIEIGRVSIPKIGLDHPIYEGVWLTVIDYGPGHWPGSALPGKRGNTVFPGHRVTHSHPFYDLDLLAPGDEVTFHMPDGDFTYSVTGTQIVVPTDLWVTDPTEEPTMTLFGCHPKHSARQRIVVKGELVRSEPSMATVAGALDLSERIGELPL